MKMAQRLSAMGMPVIVSAWFLLYGQLMAIPNNMCAAVGCKHTVSIFKQQKIYKSITDYLVYLKQNTGWKR